MATRSQSRQTRSPSERVVEATAASTGTSLVELTPLYEFVDPDALDELVQSLERGAIRFDYEGCQVRVESDGTVEITKHTTAAAVRAEPVADD